MEAEHNIGQPRRPAALTKISVLDFQIIFRNAMQL